MAIKVTKSIAKNTKKKWLIKDGRRVVGRSDTKAKAERSAGYRMEAIAKKPEPRIVKNSKSIRVM